MTDDDAKFTDRVAELIAAGYTRAEAEEMASFEIDGDDVIVEAERAEQ